MLDARKMVSGEKIIGRYGMWGGEWLYMVGWVVDGQYDHK